MADEIQALLSAATLVAKDAQQWRDKTKRSGVKLVLNALVGLLEWYKGTIIHLDVAAGKGTKEEDASDSHP